MSNKKRYALIMVLSILINQIGFSLALGFNLPVWLDSSGTALAAIVLEPAAGLLVGFVNNFYLAVVLHDAGSILYYSVSAATAIIAGVYLKKGGKISKERILPALLLLILVATTLATSITMLKTGGIPTGNWETYYYTRALSAGLPTIVSCFFGTLVVKTLDTLASAAIITIFYWVLPKYLKF